MSCGCQSYGGFFDEVTKFFQTAAPIVGGISGATTGYEQTGIGGAITGGLQGVFTGMQATQQPQVIYQQSIPSRPTITSTGAPTFYSDSLLGTGSTITQPYPSVAPPYPAATYVIPAPSAPTVDNTKLYVIAGLGFAALLGILLFRKL